MPSSRRGPVGMGPIVSVQKIPLEPIRPPMETRGNPVNGLKEVRLLCNMIVPTEDGKSKLIPRGEVVPFEDVPERWRTSEYIEAPDAFREGKVMMLDDFTCAVPTFDGDRVV
jgi:hypothetical protein